VYYLGILPIFGYADYLGILPIFGKKLKTKYYYVLYNITKCQFILAKSVPEYLNRKADTTTTKPKRTTASTTQ
jgi:hypothetical protein